MGTMRRSYRPFDAIVEGDVVQLGNNPRKVFEVHRDDADRIRFIRINRLRCGHAKNLAGETVSYCGPKMPLHYSDLGVPGGTYEFKGWLKRAGEDQ